eukprot:1102703-Pyramimonas_sp.AAC.1
MTAKLAAQLVQESCRSESQEPTGTGSGRGKGKGKATGRGKKREADEMAPSEVARPLLKRLAAAVVAFPVPEDLPEATEPQKELSPGQRNCHIKHEFGTIEIQLAHK